MTTQTNLILVTGATGQQGSAVANALLQKGKNVRVMTRNPEKAAVLAKAGAEVVKGNLTNQADVQAALRGVQEVFAMSTPFEAGMAAMVLTKETGRRSGSRSSHWTEPKPLWDTILPRCFVGSMKSDTPSTFPR